MRRRYSEINLIKKKVINHPGGLTKVDFQEGYYLYSYDNNGNIEAMYNKLDGLSGRTITYQYNHLGEITHHRDHLGSTRAVYNHTADSVAQTYDYYPFGLQMQGRSHPTGTNVREKFTAHELDTEVDLYYMVARRYAAEFGRFMSVDPILFNRNPIELLEIHHGRLLGYSPYNYTFNNSVRYTDPDDRFRGDAANAAGETVGVSFYWVGLYKSLPEYGALNFNHEVHKGDAKTTKGLNGQLRPL